MSPFALILFMGTLPGGPPTTTNRIADPAPICRASLKGNTFTTRLEYGDGHRVEGVWTVLGYVRPEDSTDPTEIAADLLLIALSESDTGMARREITPAAPVHILAVGDNPASALELASDSWCSTVHRARLAGVRFEGLALPRPGRLT